MFSSATPIRINADQALFGAGDAGEGCYRVEDGLLKVTMIGRISKRGNRYLRTLFMQGARVILLRPANWARHSFGPWLTDAAKRLHHNVLATALANKLARIAWTVLA